MRKIFRIIVVYLFVSLFIGALISYVYLNSEKLVKIALCENETDDQIDLYLQNAPEIEQNNEKVKETIMHFERKPVEFLEEIFPQLTPDPNRKSNIVKETVIGGGVKIGNIYVKDTSKTRLDLNQKLNESLAFQIENNAEPQVLIFHTHTTEAYMSGYTGYYYTDTPSRTQNNTLNVTSTGEAIKKSLEEAGIVTIHDTKIHDLEYNYSYSRSRETVQEYLLKYPSIKLTIDVHRDSMTTDEGLKYKPTTTVNGIKMAQVMLLAGSDPTGVLGYENWENNLILNLKIQDKATQLYGDLMRPLMFCERKYNMDIAPASMLIEVGTEVNTIQEAIYSGELIGDVIAQVLKE